MKVIALVLTHCRCMQDLLLPAPTVSGAELAICVECSRSTKVAVSSRCRIFISNDARSDEPASSSTGCSQIESNITRSKVRSSRSCLGRYLFLQQREREIRTLLRRDDAESASLSRRPWTRGYQGRWSRLPLTHGGCGPVGRGRAERWPRRPWTRGEVVAPDVDARRR